MNLLGLFTVLVSVALIIMAITKIQPIQRSYYLGIQMWSSWLPVVAAGFFILIVGFNLSGANQSHPIAIGNHLSSIELMVIFLASPLLMSQISNIAGLTLTIYCLERIILSDHQSQPSLAMISLLACTIIIGILGDKMPWNLSRRINYSSKRLREIFILVLSFLSLAFIFAAIMEIQGFSRWLQLNFQISFSPKLNIILLIFLLLGWLSVALGITRHFILPILCLPSLFAIAYTTNSPGYMMVIPFAMSLSLSLAISDRRLILRR